MLLVRFLDNTNGNIDLAVGHVILLDDIFVLLVELLYYDMLIIVYQKSS